MNKNRIKLPVGKIIDMRFKSYSYRTISRELAKMGINVSETTIKSRFRNDTDKLIDEDIERRIREEDDRITWEDIHIHERD
jgi:hypothetical protein